MHAPSSEKTTAGHGHKHNAPGKDGCVGKMEHELHGMAHEAGRQLHGFIDSADKEISGATHSVTKRIREKPLQYGAVAVGVGFVLGFLFRRH